VLRAEFYHNYQDIKGRRDWLYCEFPDRISSIEKSIQCPSWSPDHSLWPRVVPGTGWRGHLEKRQHVSGTRIPVSALFGITEEETDVEEEESFNDNAKD
jgi:hypothetical protein